MTKERQTAVGVVTEVQVRDFVVAWYGALDIHAPLQEVASFLADSDLHMTFPDGDIRDLDGFKKWYDRVTNLFFDENHYVHTVDTKIEGDLATVNILVGWQASFWLPPGAKSRRTSLDATQRWTVRPSKKNRLGLEIVSYAATVEPFRYAPGSARL